jgi:oligoribonuclease (3'-5' exoribonuclease)
MKIFVSFYVAALAFGSLPLISKADTPPRQINLSRFPATRLDDVVVPLPSEVFNVLDKLGAPDWRGQLRDADINKRGDRAQIALLLGNVIAEGFVTVEAHDTEEVKKVGRDVLELARAIGVEKAVLVRTNAILTKADTNDWGSVRHELDGALTDVKNAMIELKDAQLAHLVSLGGWLRGTEVLTSIVGKSYSNDSADLLNQPDLLKYFRERLTAMPSRLRNNHVVNKVQEGLDEISPLINQKITPAAVRKIHDITGHLMLAIETNG